MIELPPDARSDEITLQWVTCSACGFRALAVYEESRRGALGAECWDHRGYQVYPADLERVIGLMKECPDPNNARCACAAHRILNTVDAQGAWASLAASRIIHTFPMEMA